MKWEYKSLKPPFALFSQDRAGEGSPSVEEWEAQLNALGSEGWEFFKHDYGHWWFKRSR